MGRRRGEREVPHLSLGRHRGTAQTSQTGRKVENIRGDRVSEAVTKESHRLFNFLKTCSFAKLTYSTSLY